MCAPFLGLRDCMFPYTLLQRQEHVWSAWEITSANSGVDVEWDMNADINTYVTAGIFNIIGERLNANDGLPIVNSNFSYNRSTRWRLMANSACRSWIRMQPMALTFHKSRATFLSLPRQPTNCALTSIGVVTVLLQTTSRMLRV